LLRRHQAKCSISSVYPRLTGPLSAAALASEGPLPLACVSSVGPPLSSFTPTLVEVSESLNSSTSCSRSRSNVPLLPITVSPYPPQPLPMIEEYVTTIRLCGSLSNDGIPVLGSG